MASPDNQRLSALLERAPGPSPWYANNFPAITAHSQQRFTWTYHGEQGELAYLATLALEQEPQRPRLALNTYCVPFLLPPHFLGVWCPEPGSLRLMCFDPDELAAFPFEEIVGWFKQSNERVYAATPPRSEFDVRRQLPPGTHRIEVPEAFRGVDELIAVASCPAPTRSDAACALFVLYPQAGLVEVLPQRWFTAAEFDVGKQWIARVARDPETHRLIGEGVRMGKFELTEDGCSIERWIEKLP
jgi:hypothetical protein